MPTRVLYAMRAACLDLAGKLVGLTIRTHSLTHGLHKYKTAGASRRVSIPFPALWHPKGFHEAALSHLGARRHWNLREPNRNSKLTQNSSSMAAT